MTDAGELPFDKIYNFRDVGEMVNRHCSGRIMREKMLYRSGRLDDATSEDRRRLVQDYGIKTVIDLRTKSEHIKQSQRKTYKVNADTDPLANFGVCTVRVNFIGRKFELALLRRLDWWDLIARKFLVLMLLQFRMTAIGILGRKVLKKRGLTGLCFDSLEYCGAEIRDSLKILSDPASYPVLLHCTQGKDRTGLLCILVLFLLGAPIDAVRHEYTASWAGLAPVRKQMLVEIEEVGLDETYAMTPEELVQDVHGFLEKRWGGVEAYLESIGVGEDARGRLVGTLAA